MPRKVAILDTNILDYGFKAEYAESVKRLLETVSQDHDLVTTQYNRFELFRGMSSARISKAKQFFDTFACVDIGSEVFGIAAALSTCYKNDEATKSRASSFTDGDIIIGAAGFIYNASILTANMNDFPRPYYIDASTPGPIMSSKTGRAINIGVLAPSHQHLNEMISQLYPAASQDSL